MTFEKHEITALMKRTPLRHLGFTLFLYLTRDLRKYQQSGRLGFVIYNYYVFSIHDIKYL